MINDEDSCHMHWHRCSPAMAVPIIIIAVAQVAIAKTAHVTFWSNDAIILTYSLVGGSWSLSSFFLSFLFFFRLFPVTSLTAATGWKRKSALGSKRDKASHGISNAHHAQDGGNQ